MEIIPLSCESLGTRSFAHFVKTNDCNILIDPSVSLAPRRYGLLPHPLELSAAWRSRQLILESAKIADVIVQTHYHADHYTMGIERKYEFTDQETFNQIYTPKKKILAKDIKKNINYRQRRRGYWLWKRKELDISVADSESFTFGETRILFSPPVPHGNDIKRGYVIEVLVDDGNKRYIFTSDVSGPTTEEALNFIIANEPDIVFLDGPAYYHPHVSKEEVQLAYGNIKKILELTKELYIDHHFLREKDWKEQLKVNIGEILPAVSEILKLTPILLESKRKELHETDPPEEKFYEEFFNSSVGSQTFCEILRQYKINKYWNEIERQLQKLKRNKC